MRTVELVCLRDLLEELTDVQSTLRFAYDKVTQAIVTVQLLRGVDRPVPVGDSRGTGSSEADELAQDDLPF